MKKKPTVKEYKELYYIDRDEFHKRIKENSETPYEDMYEILKELSLDTLEKYRQEKIADDIYYETITDIDIWAEDYKDKHGVYGIEEYKWVEKSIDMKVFKLGRLQFEKIEDEKIRKLLESLGIESHALILNTHIQSGAPLDFEECQYSYIKAIDFFSKRETKTSVIIFVCDSWVLNPELQKLLKSHSNIIKFQNQYQIISSDIENRQIEERVFGSIEENPYKYTANTELQKRLKKALLEGDRFGTSRGIIIRLNI